MKKSQACRTPQGVARARVLGIRLALGFGIVAAAGVAWAGTPEYMMLKPRVGQTLEIEGAMNDDGLFVASDLEELPKARKPKLRGKIQAVDPDARTITMFGRVIHVTSDTQAANPDGSGIRLAELEPGQIIEISCRVEEGGRWEARKIRTAQVKQSEKIKGTVTWAHVDGTPPDTLEISGLRILLDAKTDVNMGIGELDRMHRLLFEDLALPDARSRDVGIPLADGRLSFSAEYRQNLRSEKEFDLSPRFRSDADDTQPEGRAALTGYWGRSFRTHAELRARRKVLLQSDQNLDSPDPEIHFTELFGLWKDVLGAPVAVIVGRQDLDEPREWLFDEYLDLARVLVYGRRSLALDAAVFHAVHPIKDKFDTWTDAFVRARWYFDKHNMVGAWMLARSDTDIRNRQPVWSGLRYQGFLRNRVRPWMDMALMRGEDKGRTLRAWALDVGATVFEPRLPWMPSVTVGYAIGSGDDRKGDGIDHAFRQTGYEDNSGRMGGYTRVHYYGEVLDPELSNLRIWTLGLGARPIADGSVDLVLHTYRQDQPGDTVRSSGLVDPPARPNGIDPHLGWGMDLVIGLPKLYNRLDAKWIVAFLDPGEGYAPRRQTAWLNKLDLRIRF